MRTTALTPVTVCACCASLILYLTSAEWLYWSWFRSSSICRILRISIAWSESTSDAKKLIVDGELTLSSGTISLQSESHPIEFRKIELLVLD